MQNSDWEISEDPESTPKPGAWILLYSACIVG